MTEMGGSARVLSGEWTDIKDLVTHGPVTEAHSAGFSFAKEKETAIGLEERRASAIFSPAAHFTGVLCSCKQKTGPSINRGSAHIHFQNRD